MIHLNWFSPLPPAETDIAHYTMRILPALAQRCQVTLWTDAASWDPALERFAKVQRYMPNQSKLDLAHDAINFFHIGNNRKFHQSIYRLAHSLPGVVVLHDLVLPNLASGLPFSSQRKQPIEPGDFEKALGIFAHSKRAAENFATQNNQAVAYHPLPYPAHKWRRARSPDSQKKCLIVFGHLGVNRRLDIVLQALQQFRERNDFQLDIYGRVSKPRALERTIRQLELGSNVTLHGFVPEEELDQALEHADLAINLRFPSMGEASGSQLRIWDHALPSLVTRGGWYADLPQGTVGYVDVENEVEDLLGHFHSLQDDPASYIRIGAKGRVELERHHSPEGYAEAIVGMAEKVSR